MSRTLLVAALLLAAAPANARERAEIAPTASLGFFLELGDEAGSGGGFVLWGGASLFPRVDPAREGNAGFVSLGVELRTGFIPLLSGPTEISPQLRAGVARLGRRDSRRKTLTFPEGRGYGIVGYRWAAAFGWDNLDGRRREEHALRLGVGVNMLGLYESLPVPLPNVVEAHMDIGPEPGVDRWGFGVLYGF